MSDKSTKYISGVASGVSNGIGIKVNAPSQYKSRQRQYMGNRTRLFHSERAYLSTDYVDATVQGILENFYTFIPTQIRLADILNTSATSSKNTDDYKIVLFPDKHIDYVPIGAKLRTMGSTWIVINPSNISSVAANCIVARCNASYNSYDYYGNIVTEPLVIEKANMLSNDDSVQINFALMDGYFNVTCQYNTTTSALGQNKRIILGSAAYTISGFTDFIQEFTGDLDSSHLLKFTIRIGEPNAEFDDMTNRIADGNTQTFTAVLNGQSTLTSGNTAQFTATFLKNGEAVTSTADYPLMWTWASSNESVITVDSNGLVTAQNAGTARLTAQLAQNSAITAFIDLVVEQVTTTPYVAFTGLIPTVVGQYQTSSVSAVYYENGAATAEVVTWSFNGANTANYNITTSGNTIQINCLGGDNTPLTVTASCNGYTVSAQITLEGY